MTDEALRGLAFQAANMAKRDLRQKGELNGLVAVYHEGDALHRMRDFEAEVIQLAGKNWLDSNWHSAPLL